MRPRIDVTRVRALFISDVHLGTMGCRAEPLLGFLRSYEAETIYLVGDIVDGWRLRPGRPWPRSHVAVMAELLARARGGVRVIYVPGNHDKHLRRFAGLTISGIEVAERAIHETRGGRRYLVLHGDQLDRVVQRFPLITVLGNWVYRASLLVSHPARPQRRLGLCCRAVSARAKLMIRAAVDTISHSDRLLMAEVMRLGVHGVICGHTHHAADCSLAGIHYVNTGDWVESCTGAVEDHDGRLALARWVNLTAPEAAHPVVQPGATCPLEDDEVGVAA